MNQVWEWLGEEEADHHGNEGDPGTDSSTAKTSFTLMATRAQGITAQTTSSLSARNNLWAVSREVWTHTGRNRRRVLEVEARGMVREERSTDWFSSSFYPIPASNCTTQQESSTEQVLVLETNHTHTFNGLSAYCYSRQRACMRSITTQQHKPVAARTTETETH